MSIHLFAFRWLITNVSVSETKRETREYGANNVQYWLYAANQ